jgi:hypothetical protein
MESVSVVACAVVNLRLPAACVESVPQTEHGFMSAVLLIEFTSVETSSRETLGSSNWLHGRFLYRGPPKL